MADGASQTLLTPLLHSQGKDPALIGGLVAVSGVVSLLMRIPGGLLYSPKRARPAMLAAMAVAALATALQPLTGAVGLFAGIRMLYGFGFSVSTTVNMAIFVDSITRDEDRRRSAGIYASAMSSGYTLGSLAGGFAGQQLGFRTAYLGMAALWLVAAVPVLLRPPNLAARAAPSGPVVSRGTRVRTFGSVLLEPPILAMILGGLFINLNQSLFITFSPLVLLAIGLGVSEIGILRAVFSFTNTLTRPVAGLALEHFDHRRAQHAGLLINGGMLMLFALPLGFGPYLAVAVLAASGRGFAIVANTVALTQDVDPSRVSRGIATGILNASLDLGNVAGPVIGGLIASWAGIHTLWLIAPPLYLFSYFSLQVWTRLQSSPMPGKKRDV